MCGYSAGGGGDTAHRCPCRDSTDDNTRYWSASAPVSTVTITASPGDTIYFTTTGAVPTSSSPVYSAPITIGDTAVIKAIARNGGVDSLVCELCAE
ncbi:MAG: chitobiase/beta-hexosaminidase C-terminal domain-containing protein [Candidatus Obscuribacter sp.]|nr:chitobiase/beta-hexosaminidase C-terminal domain-containing protein [Candidatus Obscuribacter sp.]